MLFELSSAFGRCMESGVFLVKASAEGCAKSAHCFKTSTFSFKTLRPFGMAWLVTISNAFTNQNFTIITPFTQTTNNQGNIAYKGAVENGEKTLVPYVHNVSIEETKNRNQSIAQYNAYIKQATAHRYAS